MFEFTIQKNQLVAVMEFNSRIYSRIVSSGGDTVNLFIDVEFTPLRYVLQSLDVDSSTVGHIEDLFLDELQDFEDKEIRR